MRGHWLYAFLARLIIAVALSCAMAYADPAPSFWDPDLRLEKPDLTGIRAIRFSPATIIRRSTPALGDGTLDRISDVEIARAVCAELEIACTIQARRWDTLIGFLW